MSAPQDIRVIRTRNMLVDALARLTERTDAEKIGVVELTHEAQVNRSTFYLHYADMHDFLERETHRLVDGLVVQASESAEADAGQFGYYVGFFRYVREHADFFRVMLGPHGYAGFQTYFVDRGKQAYQQHMHESGLPDGSALNSSMVANYISSAHAGVIRWWLGEGMQYSPEAMANALKRLTVDGVLETLEMDRESWIPA